MSGLYIHIPFCKQACHYCDFHFSTNLQLKNQLVAAICKEIYLQKEYFGPSSKIETIYFGGGTPSLLDEADLNHIFETIHKNFSITLKPEITLEANPDDLTFEKLQILKHLSINRLSIGIQSFYAPHLVYLNRAHTAQEAKTCVYTAQETGFDNISIDLIYAIPYADHSIWESDLTNALALNVQHISAYCLTIESQTAFGKWLRKGKIKSIDEEFAVEQFLKLLNTLEKNGFEQYEISNFALPDYYSKHNTNYWRKESYLGIGPSAHSFNGTTRQYNLANNVQYIKSISNDTIPYTLESLSLTDQVNEYVMTSLRTKWGCNLKEISQWSGINFKVLNQKYIEDCLQQDLVMVDNEILQLTTKGKLLADKIASDLFIV